MPLAQLRKLAAKNHFDDICSVLKALDRKKELALLQDIKEKYPNLPDPLLSGNDLKQLGFSTGEKLGQLIEIIRKAQLNNEIHSQKDAINLLNQLKDK